MASIDAGTRNVVTKCICPSYLVCLCSTAHATVGSSVGWECFVVARIVYVCTTFSYRHLVPVLKRELLFIVSLCIFVIPMCVVIHEEYRVPDCRYAPNIIFS